MTTYAPFPLIEIFGSPRERGRTHGKAAADRLRRGIRMYSESLLKSGVDWRELERRAEAMVPTIERFDPSYVEEMRGIAEGSGEPFAGVVLMNARTEMVVAARKQKEKEQLLPDGCTAALALPSVSADGVLLHGQNWDWRAECAETGVVLRIRRDDGPDILTFTEAGGLARSGLNSAGIGLTANALECDRDYQRGPGVPLPFVRRKVLESAHLAQAVHTIVATPKLGSNHMAVSHCDGEAFGFECAPDETFWLTPEDGLYVHANHWIAPSARARVKDTGLAETPCSIYRDKRVRERLEPRRGKLSLGDFRQAFFDDWGAPWSVCRPPRPSVRGVMSATTAMILMRPGEGHLEACPMPALNRQFTTYKLEPDATARRAAAE
ncbi:MAG: C45 family autoproteolytic acyltransferase/hydrolase [Reyranella sp.]|uniref:C45 family autoproteolytic acyltransferase/hydolase n=1 Tax=Reyranella sp. TaxID=1929291 RepID=UPI003D140E9E